MRPTATAWDTALRAGSESVVCDLPADADFAQALCARADVVLEGFRPGVAARLGVGPDDVPTATVYCSITGFGWTTSATALRAGHDVNYLGWAGVLEDTDARAPAGPDRRPRGRCARRRDAGPRRAPRAGANRPRPADRRLA